MLGTDHLDRPLLRPVEAFPVQMDGQDYICLRDPENLAEQPVFLNKLLIFLVSRMDGNHSLRDIQADYLQASGEILPMESLEDLAKQLDEQHYLDGPIFRNYYQALVQEFEEAQSRPARHAGSAYEGSGSRLAAQIQSFFTHPDGPGGIETSPDASEPLRGLIAPHIDFTRGGPTYAHAYKALDGHPGADTFVILGTCHTPMRQRFSISYKDYETPLGTAVTDKNFVSRLAARLNGRYLGDFSHRVEHSIEFQAVCLKYILGNKQDFKIIPILVGSFHDIYANGNSAAENSEIQDVVGALQKTMEESSGHVCIIAGADLAHIGRQFGDPSAPTESWMREIELADRNFLGLAEEGNAEGVFQSIAADCDRRRVCGFPPIYMALRCIDKPRGKLLQYRQWVGENEGAAVTFAAMAIY